MSDTDPDRLRLELRLLRGGLEPAAAAALAAELHPRDADQSLDDRITTAERRRDWALAGRLKNRRLLELGQSVDHNGHPIARKEQS